MTAEQDETGEGGVRRSPRGGWERGGAVFRDPVAMADVARVFKGARARRLASQITDNKNATAERPNAPTAA